MDRQSLRRAAAKAPQVIIEQGAVFIVPDELIVLPEGDGRDTRGGEKTRRVVVLQGTEVCVDPNVTTVLVAPTSATIPPGPYDFEPPDDEVMNGFTESATVFVSLIQPFRKSDLVRRVGVITEELPDIRNCMLRLIGCLR